MKSIEHTYSHEIIIKNSRFICYMIPLLDDKIDSILSSIREEHPKATHVCYAYKYDDIVHSSDDGEPGGTAGMPILNVLEKEDLNRVIILVVRYFGGIKLGAGGLVRAYTKSVTETIKNSSFVTLIPGYKITIHFPYDEEKNVLFILGNSTILNKEYLEDVSYTCLISSDTFEKLYKYNPTILEKSYIKDSN